MPPKDAVAEGPSVASNRRFFLTDYRQSRDFAPLLRWLILVSVTAFGALMLWNLGLIQSMLATDRTRVSSLIIGLFVLSTLHCLAQTWSVSRELVSARRFRQALDRESEPVATTLKRSGVPSESAIAQHVANLVAKARSQRGRRIDQTLLLRALSDRLRGREKIGVFVSEALLRLALLGTAVGFILMLTPLAALTAFDAESLRKALAGMSGGMAIALNITVTGIATAVLLKLQYFFLDKAVVELFDIITETTEVHVVSALESDDGG